MGRRTPDQPAQPDDPLADLREPDEPGLPLGPVQENGQGPTLPDAEDLEVIVDIRPMVSQETHDELVAEAVAAWHQDPTSQGFLHGGGQCGCRYLARIALTASVPVMTEEDLEERELEPASD